jgi:hypothetical protein
MMKSARVKLPAARMSLTILLKRLLPFALTLMFGLALTNLMSFVKSPAGKADDSSAGESMRSRTWLVIYDVPALNYTEQEAREKGAFVQLSLFALLDADGTVSEVELATNSKITTPEFVFDASRIARRIKFRPATEDGRPIPLRVRINYNCSDDSFAHRWMFQCSASIVEVERDWRTIYE